MVRLFIELRLSLELILVDVVFVELVVLPAAVSFTSAASRDM
jgi:hypothetical protein